MNIDIRTLATVIGVTNVIQLIVIFLQYSVNKNYRGIGWFALGYTSMALGLLLHAVFDVSSFSIISIYSSNILFLLGFIFLYAGFMRFLDKKENRPIVVSILTVFLLSQFYYTYVSDDITLRTVIRSVAVAIVSFLTAYSLFVYKNRFITVSANFTAAVFLAQACSLGFYTFATLTVFPVGGISNIFDPTLSKASLYLVTLINMILWMFGLIIMINQRLNGELKEAKERIELIFNTSPDAALISRLDDGVIVNINAGFTNLTGFTRDEAIGKSSLDINVWQNPADRKKIVDELREKGHLENYGGVFVRKDGIQRFGMVSANVIMLEDVPHVVSITRDITRQKIAEEELQRERDQAQKYLDIAGVMMGALDAAGNITMINRRGCDVLGYEEHEIMCRNWFDICIHPELRETVKSVFEKLMAGDIAPVEYYENPVVTKHGEQRIIAFHNTIVHDESGRIVGVLFSGEDISERKRSEQDLRESEERMRLLIDSAPIAIRIATQGVYSYLNPAFINMFGYSCSEEIEGLPVEALYVEEDKCLITERNANRAMGLEVDPHYRVTGIKKDGTRIDLDAWGSEISYQGQRSTLRFLIDVTESNSLRAQLLQAQKMEAVGTLAGGIAHDFNNLLQAVLGYSDFMLQRKKEGERDYADLQKIYQAGRRGADLVKSLLTFSRKVETKHVPVNLNQEITQVQHLLSRTIPKTIKIELHLSGDLESINADSSQIGQVLMNLGVNARDAMPDGGILSVETANVQLDEQYCSAHLETKPGSYVLLTVSDTGQGMEVETLSHIFEPFFTTKETGKGTGLGLATVYGIVKQHGGHINCDSEIGHGTTFKIYFPAIQTELNRKAPTPEPAIPRGTETVLLVDDEEFLRELASRLLSEYGYHVILAANGKEALEIYQAEGQSIALVILDLIMPEMDGWQCLAEILRIDPNAKVLIASGYSESGPSNLAVADQVKGFVEKPYQIKKLLSMVRTVLDEG